jgi:outer membrane lipoprotein carrier protein
MQMKLLKTCLGIALGSVLLFVVAPLQAQQAALPVNPQATTKAGDWALQQLVGLLKQTESLTADVEQLLLDQDGRELQETRAQLMMQKPSNFRWEVTQPYSELMVTDGTTIWRYEPDLEQVTIQKFNGDLDRTPVMLLNGSAESIGASYSVSAAAIEGGNQMRFVLQPKQSNSLFEHMNLTFAGAALLEMQFEDSLGQQTSLTFSNMQRNQAPAASNFQFTPPAKVEIIDSRDK